MRCINLAWLYALATSLRLAVGNMAFIQTFSVGTS